ncbi:thiol:disulfide interchange protein DsbG [Shigella flexneri]
MYNEKGENLSNTLIKKEIYAPSRTRNVATDEQSHWLLDSKECAVIYVFSNPFCPYCKQFWQQARPSVDSGKVQFKHCWLGLSSQKARRQQRQFLPPKNPAKTWQQYEASGCKLKLNVPANVSTEQMKVLSDNEKLMDNLGAKCHAGYLYMSKENTLQQAVGLPNQKTLNIIMGNK